MRKNNGAREYLVKWVGWGSNTNTWETHENLMENCKEQIDLFLHPPAAGSTRVEKKARTEMPVRAAVKVILREDEIDKKVMELSSWESDVRCVENLQRSKEGYVSFFEV
jgi:hypothetical protein